MSTIKKLFWKALTWITIALLDVFTFVFAGFKWLWKRYPEVYSVPVAFALYWFSAVIIRWLDPTSAVFDGGVLQIPLFAILLLFLFMSISWVAMGLLFGTARKFLVSDLKESFIKLSPWQKIRYSTGILFLLFYSLVALSFTLA